MDFSEFRQMVVGKLEDETLQRALSKALNTVRIKSPLALRELRDVEGHRDEASRRRGLDANDPATLLLQLEANLRREGTEVLWAKTDGDARALVAGIARKHGVTRAILSKSMVAEEVELEQGLKGAGVVAIQTDLGERIVQLAGEKPSHITAPCLHKTAGQIGRLLTEKMGMEATDSPHAISRFLAQRMRPVFLKAQMGVSGANLAVAGTGHLVMVENEGNVRMGWTLPPVHVVLVGIDKVMNDFSEMEHIVNLLPRMATGQRITCYVSVLAPAPLPGQKRYVVLVDNGRSTLFREGPFRELLKCIRCGACMNVCPVYEKVGGHAYGWTYPGPVGIAMMPLMGPPGMASMASSLCTLCGACSDVCPVRIPLDKLIVLGRARANRLKAKKDYRRERRLFGSVRWAFGGSGRFRFTHWGHRLGARTWPSLVRRVEGRMGWDGERLAPQPAKELFRKKFRRRAKGEGKS